MKFPVEVRPLAFTKLTLDNGLEVIVRRQANLPIVAVNLWYHVGSKNEERRQRGFAHLFEHLMFEGSEHYPGDFFKPLQRLGANVNGSTSSDRTNYFEDLPAAHLELALAMESDRMGHLLPALSDSKIRIQKDVVKNEYRQNYSNRPYGQVWQVLSEALYPPNHPYSWLTIGVMEDVESASREEIESFFRKFYLPSNASLALVGDLDEDRAFSLAEHYFRDLGGGLRSLTPWAPEVRLLTDRNLVMRDRVELERVYAVWPTVPQFHQDEPSLTLLADILASGKSSRLYQQLVVTSELAQDVAVHQSSRELGGTFGAVLTLRPGRDRDAAFALVERAIESIARHGVTEQELERVQTRKVASFIYALDNIGGFGGMADRLNAYNIFLGDPGRITSDVARFQAVTPEQIHQAAQTYIFNRPKIRLHVLGRGVVASSTSPAPDRSKAPGAGPPVVFRGPTPHVIPLRCGMSLWSLVKSDLPMIAATAAFRAGGGTHGPHQGGLAKFTANVMDEGTFRRDARTIAETAESMATSLYTSCGWDGGYVGFVGLSKFLEPSLDLATDLLARPSFPQDHFLRIQGQTLASLQAEHDSAEPLAWRVLLRSIYGPDHPYHTTLDGSIPSIQALTREDLIAFHGSRYRPDRGLWVIAGDIDPDVVARHLDDMLGDGWTTQSPPPSLDDEPPDSKRRGPRLILVDKPGAAQSVVRVGQVGPRRDTTDFADLLVVNHLFGGMFLSRLNRKLREEKGYTYGVRSGFDFRRGVGPFSVAASIQSEKTAEALLDLRHELEDLVGERPPTLAECDDARRAIIESQARSFETPSALVGRYAGLFLHGLPPDYYQRFPDLIQAVTVETAAAAACRWIHPEEAAYVVVGDAQELADSLRHLEWCELEIIRFEA